MRMKRKAKIQTLSTGPYLLAIILISKRGGRCSSSLFVSLSVFFLVHFRFCLDFIVAAFRRETEREAEPRLRNLLRRWNRSVENRWPVESLNHGVVQWLQGRRKPRVGCAGQNCTGPFFDWNLLSCATHAFPS